MAASRDFYLVTVPQGFVTPAQILPAYGSLAASSYGASAPELVRAPEPGTSPGLLKGACVLAALSIVGRWTSRAAVRKEIDDGRSSTARTKPPRMLASKGGNSDEGHWMDHLKFGGATPSFDVIEKTKEYNAASQANGGLATDYHASDYIFRGSIVGPITGEDVAETQADFNLLGAYLCFFQLRLRTGFVLTLTF